MAYLEFFPARLAFEAANVSACCVHRFLAFFVRRSYKTGGVCMSTPPA